MIKKEGIKLCIYNGVTVIRTAAFLIAFLRKFPSPYRLIRPANTRSLFNAGINIRCPVATMGVVLHICGSNRGNSFIVAQRPRSGVA